MKKNMLFVAMFLAMSMTSFSRPITSTDAKKAATAFLQSKTNTNAEIRLIDFADRASYTNFYVFGND